MEVKQEETLHAVGKSSELEILCSLSDADAT